MSGHQKNREVEAGRQGRRLELAAPICCQPGQPDKEQRHGIDQQAELLPAPAYRH